MLKKDIKIELPPSALDTELPPEMDLAAQWYFNKDGKHGPAEPPKKPVGSKPSYPQDNWSAYNQAQMSEKDFFQHILDELLAFLPPEPVQGRGRPRVSLRDQIFALCLQQYLGLSSRRSICDLNHAEVQHLLFQRIHFNTLLKFYGNPTITLIVKQLIEITASPLASVETSFAVDSTGFSVSQFQRWYDAKYGKEKNIRVWKKCHITCGAKTNIITAVTVTPGTTNDCRQLPDLLRRTNQYFTMQEVTADKAYSSKDNLNFIQSIGAQPYIPFKKNTVRKGFSFWSKMFREFMIHQAEFMEHYHKRSNVESTFSMMKRKLGMKLRTKTEVSQTNEILVKCLVHNLCVLVMEYYTLGIQIDFDKSANLGANGIKVQPNQN